jgi:hypothetical protein
LIDKIPLLWYFIFMHLPIFRRSQRAGVDDELIERINGHEIKDHQEAVVVSVQYLAREALRHSGFTAEEAHSELAQAAMTYATHIVIAELRVSGHLQDWMLHTQSIEAATGVHPHLEIRDRMGLPAPESQVD